MMDQLIFKQKRPVKPCAQVRVAIGLIATAALLSLSACSVPSLTQAPQTAAPAVPAQWLASESAKTLEQGAAMNTASSAVSSTWWQAFGDNGLNQWVALTAKNNNDLLAAAARLQEARANLAIAGAAAMPQLSATGAASAGRSLGARGLTQSQSLQPGLQASWELDLWGRIEHLRQAADLRAQASAADRDAVALAVAATTTQAYLGLRSLQAQLALARSTVKSREDALRLANDQVRVGYISHLQQSQAQAELEGVRQTVEQLSLALERQRLALLQLAGGPGDAEALALLKSSIDTSSATGLQLGTRQFQQLKVPGTPALGLPSQLLERRPDIARAQWQLAAADQSLAAQRAAFLPQVNLSASVGSLLINALDYNPATLWSLGGSILAPLFTGGRLQGQFDVAAAQRDQAAYAYRAVVTKALGEVENALLGERWLQTQLAHASERAKVLERTLGFAKDRYEAGYASYLEELDAQRNLFSAQQEVIRLRQAQLENAIALYQALGGGWTADGAAASGQR